MSRCTCSVRALEAFVRDFAGVQIASNLRQPLVRRPRNLQYFSTRPALSIRQSPSRNLEGSVAASNHSIDDTYVPFEYSHASTSTLKPSQAAVRGASSLPPKVEALEIEDFEPELEVLSDIQFSQDATDNEHHAAQELPAAVQKTSPYKQGTTFFADIISYGPDSHATGSTQDETHDLRTRTERRKERRARREAEGKILKKNQVKPEALVTKDAPKSSKSHKAADTACANGERSLPARKDKIQDQSQGSRRTRKSTKIASMEPREKSQAGKDAAQGHPRQSAKASLAKRPASDAGNVMTTGKSSKTEEQSAQEDDTRPAGKPQEDWGIYKSRLEAKFGDRAWQPRKRISPDALAGIRALRSSQPDVYTTEVLANHFKVSPEAIRRILKSKWQPSEDESEDRRKRWEKRGEKKWTEMVEQGVRPPKKWREMGVGRAAKGEVPAWKKGSGVKKSERWIDEPDADVFHKAAAMQDDVAEWKPSIADRIL